MKSSKENAKKKEPRGKTKPATGPANATKPPSSATTEKTTAAGTVAHGEVGTYSPPCTRSQKERFQKRQMEEQLGASNAPVMLPDVGTDLSVLRAMENLCVDEKKPAGPKKNPPGTKTKAAAKAPAAAPPPVKPRQEKAPEKQPERAADRGNLSRRRNKP
ncbi:hypothetical protein V5799_008316 [Amblyomma americanum]|uniref:Uncharacterized protein n=1 Tax=Amblyomma americanum TaxID=6943 RepID=A0AAQ4FDR8_AMBAM